MTKFAGKFITFEGGEGCGKSTQIRLLADFLRARGDDVLVTREPGGSEGAEKIRELLLSERKNFSPKNEVLLNFAARLDHIEKIIQPALTSGKTVLSDRFFDSTYVYQGVAQGVSLEFIDKVKEISIGEFAPDITFVLDIDPQKALARALSRGDTNHFEAMGLQFHEKIRQGFVQRTIENPQRFVMLNADVTIEELHSQITANVDRLLQRTT